MVHFVYCGPPCKLNGACSQVLRICTYLLLKSCALSSVSVGVFVCRTCSVLFLQDEFFEETMVNMFIENDLNSDDLLDRNEFLQVRCSFGEFRPWHAPLLVY